LANAYCYIVAGIGCLKATAIDELRLALAKINRHPVNIP